MAHAVCPCGVTSPERAWVEAFPEGRSYVRRAATKYSFVCPVLGGDLGAIIREGQFALAQAYYRQGAFQEAADLFNKLLQETAPTAALLRGLGLSLARLQGYDQAYKHLRAALEQEQPKDPFTAAYLALCGAMGRPTQPEDKPKNVTWAVRLLSKFAQTGNAEWAGVMSTVHAEARELLPPLAVEDQTQLCDVLASVAAVDAQAAAAYHQLAATHPDAVKPIYAWLYVRAAVLHDFRGAARSGPFRHGIPRCGACTRVFRSPKVEFRRRRIRLPETQRGRDARPFSRSRSAPITLRRANSSFWTARIPRNRRIEKTRPWNAWRHCCGWRR